MEWLDFNRWSPDVEQQLVLQAARLSALAGPRSRPQPESASARFHRLNTLLRQSSSRNPWGHPTAEC